MSVDFITAFSLTALIEGGYSNDKDDSGGETWAGIARNKQPAWPGWTVVDLLKKERNFPANLPGNAELKKRVSAFYKTEVWNALNLSELQDQRIVNELFDTGVNMGIGRAGLFLQRALNALNRNGVLFPDLPLTGFVGVKTITAFNCLNAADKALVWKLVNCQQGVKYIDFCEASGTQEKFMRSWLRRVFEAA